MAKGFITRAFLENTADAIRVLGGESNTYTPDEFGEKILTAIPDVTVTDSIVSVTDAAAYPAEELEFAIEPVQDLHGYDKPWPAGGGKNLLPDTIDSVVSSLGCTFSLSGNNLSFVGTASIDGGRTRWRSNNFSLSAGTYYFKSFNSNGHNKTTPAIHIQNGDTNMGVISPTNPAVSFTINEDSSNINIGVNVNSGYEYEYTATLAIFTSNEDTYEPYANICSISGWTGVNGEQRGKNLVFKTIPQVNINNYGLIYAQNSYSLAVGRVKAGITYIVTTDDIGRVCGFFENEPKIGSISYNNRRVIDESNKPFTAPIDGYVAFRISSNYATPQLELGSTATAYEPYQGTSIPITFPALGKNKFGPNTTVVTDYYLNEWGNETHTKHWYISDYISVEPSTQYTFNPNSTAGAVAYHYFYDAQKNKISGITSGAITFTTPQNCVFMRFSYRDDSSNIQLELGNQDTSYEPYNNTVYGGKVDVVNGKLTVTDVKYVIDGVPNGFNNMSDGGTYKFFSKTNYVTGGKTTTATNIPKTLWCNLFDPKNVVALGNTYISGDYFRVCADPSFQDVNEFNAWIASVGGIEYVYELAESIEYDITPQQVQMLLGNNNIWCDTGDTTLEYKVDLSRFIAKLQAAQATPQLSLSRQAVSLDADEIEEVDEPVLYDEVKASADEPIEDNEDAEKLPVEDVESVDVVENDNNAGADI